MTGPTTKTSPSPQLGGYDLTFTSPSPIGNLVFHPKPEARCAGFGAGSPFNTNANIEPVRAYYVTTGRSERDSNGRKAGARIHPSGACRPAR